jgi:hypothetical protein
VTWSCPRDLCVQAVVACFYNLGKKMRLNVMPCCGDLASAAQLALPVTSEVELQKLKDTRVAFLILCGRTHVAVECEKYI